MPSDALFEPFALHDLILSNRMVMAPMTRNRADGTGLVNDLMVAYYRQRAMAGLIITESTPVSVQGIGYPSTPCLYTEAQARAWKPLTQAVQSAGGHIFVQLQHCGRISHPSFQPNGALPVSASAVKPEGQVYTYDGPRDLVTPQALSHDGILEIVGQFARAAELARLAGFDGVEIHAGNGYLIDQFLRDGTNRRCDEYGGSVERRYRLLEEVIEAVEEHWPSHRIGVRLTPENRFNSMSDSAAQVHFEYFARRLGSQRLAFLDVLEGDMSGMEPAVDYSALKGAFKGPYIANHRYDLARAKAAIETHAADLVAFGAPFLANPDLVRRYRDNLPLNSADSMTFYTGGSRGYIDYPEFDRSLSTADADNA